MTLTSDRNIPSVLNFEGVSFQAGEDYVLEFPVQAPTSEILIKVSGSITKYNGDVQPVESSERISIYLERETNNFVDFYLGIRSEDYVLRVLGRNGEEIHHSEISIIYTLEGRTEDFESVNLVSDDKGEIMLGKLHTVRQLTAKGMFRNR